MVTIRFWNREGYVRFSIQICLTYHNINLPSSLGGSVNVTILVFPNDQSDQCGDTPADILEALSHHAYGQWE